MDKDEAINTFVRYNRNLLTSTDATTSLVKKMRKDHISKIQLKSGAIFKFEDAKKIMKTILLSIDRNPRYALPLNRIMIVEGVAIEKQIGITNAMIKRELINITPLSKLDITEKGKEVLEELMGEKIISFKL